MNMNGEFLPKAPSRRSISAGCIVIAACGLMVLARGFVGFSWGDEANYFAMTDRFLRGDLMIAHEWHPTQWFSAFLLPFYALYVRLNGSSDGVILCFRIAYAFFSTALALIVYRALCPRKGVWPVLAGVLINLFYAVGYLGAFSYNTLATNFLALSTAGLYLYARGAGGRLLPFGCGAAYAVAAASYPYLAGLYFAGLALALLPRAGKRWRVFFVYATLGVAAVAIPYLAFLLRGGSFSDLARCFQFILRDPEHVAKPPLRKAYEYVRWLIRVFGPSLAPSVALIAAIAFKRLTRRAIGGVEGRALLMLGAAACAWQTAEGWNYECAALFALALYGFTAFIMAEKPDRAMFAGMFLPGFYFSVAMYFSSNTGFRSLSSGLAVSAAAACCLVWDALHALEPAEPSRLRRAAAAASALGLAAVVAATGFMRIGPLVRPEQPDQTSARIESGPGAGLLVSPDEAGQYQAVYDTIRQYASGEGNLIITRLAPWAYMVSPMRCGAPTTWRLRFNEEWLGEYMNLYPDRRPDVIVSLLPAYDPRGYAWDLPEDTVGPEKLNRALLDYANANGMERIDTKSAVLFRRRAPG